MLTDSADKQLIVNQLPLTLSQLNFDIQCVNCF